MLHVGFDWNALAVEKFPDDVLFFFATLSNALLMGKAENIAGKEKTRCVCVCICTNVPAYCVCMITVVSLFVSV